MKVFIVIFALIISSCASVGSYPNTAEQYKDKNGTEKMNAVRQGLIPKEDACGRGYYLPSYGMPCDDNEMYSGGGYSPDGKTGENVNKKYPPCSRVAVGQVCTKDKPTPDIDMLPPCSIAFSYQPCVQGI